MLAAISPCPNDTYVFGAWILGLVGDLPFARTRFVWEDVQTLNEMAAEGLVDMIKVSAVQGIVLEDYKVLSCGGAFGLGQGPKLVVRSGWQKVPRTIAVPGMQTTAYALLKAAADFDFEPVPMLFHEIPQAVRQGTVCAGLLIHETALIYKSLGLEISLDIGDWWDRATECLPLPLGLIVVRKKSGSELVRHAEQMIRKSLDLVRLHPEQVMPLIRSLAREINDQVISEHINAYVNRYSYDMGDQGLRALEFLRNRVIERGNEGTA